MVLVCAMAVMMVAAAVAFDEEERTAMAMVWAPWAVLSRLEYVAWNRLPSPAGSVPPRPSPPHQHDAAAYALRTGSQCYSCFRKETWMCPLGDT